MALRPRKRFLEFDLSPTGIDRASEWLVESLNAAGLEKPDCVRSRLLFEESLLNFADRFGPEHGATVYVERRRSRLQLRLVVKGERFNPLGSESVGAQDDWETSLFSVLNMRAHYSYSAKANVVRMALPQRVVNPVLKIALAILVGLVVGVLGNVFVPDPVQEAISGAVLQPIADMWVRVLQAISGPIIFLTALTATLGTKRLADFGGSRISPIVRYFAFSAVAVAFAMVCAEPFFPFEIAATEANGQVVAGALTEVLKVVPGNLVEPFITANTPQLLLLAIATGYLLASVESPISELRSLIEQLNSLGLTVAKRACELVPFFVGLLLCLKIWTHDTDLLGSIWLPLVLSVAISAAVLVVVVLATSVRLRVSPFLLARKLEGPFREALGRGTMDYSSVDGLANSCKTLLGISGDFARAALPQGLMLYMPTSAVGICTFSLFAAQTQQIFIDQVWLLSAAAVSVVLAVATPPLTGANLLSFIMAFGYLGISSEALLDVMVFDILFGVLCIAFDQAALQLDVAWQAKRLGFLDEDVLHAPII